jgi:uncharacterized membrane protein YfbV (UPF0208 family)
MSTNRRPRPTGAPAYYLGRSATRWLDALASIAIVALGLVLTDKKEITQLTKDLHIWFKEKYGVTCCKTIRQTHKGVCPVLTGEVAGKIAEMLASKSP